MKVLVAGDLHLSMFAARRLVEKVHDHEAEMVWQTGDFGYWPRLRPDTTNQFLDILESSEVPVLFADGNHEDHFRLGSDSDQTGMTWFRGNVAHVKRGTVADVNGIRVLFYGGARSVDRQWRTTGEDWFPEELPTHAQFEKAMALDPVDVVVAHEVPNWVEFGYPPIEAAFWPAEDLVVSGKFRVELAKMAMQLGPRVWFGGHHHVRRSVAGDDSFPDVHVLNQNGQPGSFVIFDTETFEVTDV